MKTYSIILSAAIAVIAFSSCSEKTRSADSGTDTALVLVNDTTQQGLSAKMELPASVKAGDSVILKFIVYNSSGSIQQFCKWHTPFEPLMSKYLEVKDQNGDEAMYRGPMAKRMMPPPAGSYIKVNPKDSLSASVDVLKAYAITKPGKYSITYSGQNMSGLIVKDSISFNYIK
jgi:hypothetical protein